MFSINSIEITNFRSFRGEHSFVFPKKPGLYSITGKNIDNSRLGSNGVGKSSLLEAIFWAIYGKTTRSLKGSDIISWGEKSARVKLSLAVGDCEAIINRGQSPNSLYLSGKPVEQDAINKFLRIGPEAFLYAVMLPQFGSSFFDLTPANKLTLFSEIMGLDFWLEKSTKASDRVTNLLCYKSESEKLLSKIDGQIESTIGTIKALEDKQAHFDESWAKEQLVQEEKLKILTSHLPKYEKQLKTAKEAMLGAEARLARVIKDIQKGSGRECPTCKQKLPSPDLKQLEQDKRAISKNRDDFSQEQRLLEDKIFSAKKDIENVKAKIGMKKTPVFAQMIAGKKKELASIKARAEDKRVEIRKQEEEHAAVSYWVTGFKRIRLFLVEETLKQLEIEVNNNLMALSLTDWRVEFDVERENKSGGVTKGFTVFVYPPNQQPIRYEAFCGGETQRLRLAGDLGLANLIMERAGLRNTFEAYDEPSQHMSQEGLMDLVEALADRAETSGKIIFLVDHHSIDFGGFAGTITITKDEKGSRVE